MKKQIDLNDSIYIDLDVSVLAALERMDSLKRKLLIILKEGLFYGVLSIGDIQRAILNKIPLESKIESILRKEITICYDTDDFEKVKEKMIRLKAECMPIIDGKNKLVNVIFWEDVFGVGQKRKEVSLNIPVVIMAGGKGTRLKPLTNILPKPLLPINERTIIEDIMNRFVEVGCSDFHLSVNYKAKTIKDYFKNLNNPDYSINYFQEDKPLGTAGSMFLIKDKINSTFFVSNCDILIDQDLEEVYNYHKENGNEITMISAIKRYKIPYGTIETKKDGVLERLDEKPDLIFQINTGVYVLEPSVLKYIPENEFFHITELIEIIKKASGKVGVFPIAENSWQDIGNWSDYDKILEKIK
ncbi:Nucleotidyl transferase [Tenacibaculum sp. MAR_2010_89]|uniref:nucleotidyltransferase family protein n=1 Tax=Tenacibaculum sp. MAR_2010_89 TaxID=1250198 RepID=UPI0008973B7B|nr:nucleotidyltransferase family protein [Tenacibaculum sp. MAR_2010_89]SED67920.1 Nucleotidyl transferase [Tenacibaculum sp. MAR_2010_89]